MKTTITIAAQNLVRNMNSNKPKETKQSISLAAQARSYFERSKAEIKLVKELYQTESMQLQVAQRVIDALNK